MALKDENLTLFKSLTNGELILYIQQKRQSHAFDSSTKNYFLQSRLQSGTRDGKYRVHSLGGHNGDKNKKIKKMPNDQ